MNIPAWSTLSPISWLKGHGSSPLRHPFIDALVDAARCSRHWTVVTLPPLIDVWTWITLISYVAVSLAITTKMGIPIGQIDLSLANRLSVSQCPLGSDGILAHGHIFRCYIAVFPISSLSNPPFSALPSLLTRSLG